jgi:2-polyprenyl-3-methyl-5-hydroxy-6-metoxy-1,4-benzoquinol methylase
MKPLDRFLQWWRIGKARPYLFAGSRVLDIGCAEGELFRLVPAIGEGVGVDPDLPQAVPSFANARLVRGMFPEALTDSRPFDVITLLAVVEHIPAQQLAQLASDCMRFLKPGGHLIITVPSPRVDVILSALRFMRLVHGMALEQHHGFDPLEVPAIFSAQGLKLKIAKRFQLGLNNLFVFERPKEPASLESPLVRARS